MPKWWRLHLLRLMPSYCLSWMCGLSKRTLSIYMPLLSSTSWEKKDPIQSKNPIVLLFLSNSHQHFFKVNGQPVILKGQGSTRESFPRTVSEPLAIVSITLQGLADDGPSRPTFEHLIPYLRGNTCYINLDFNFGSLPEIQSFSERLEAMVDLFESGQLQR